MVEEKGYFMGAYIKSPKRRELPAVLLEQIPLLFARRHKRFTVKVRESKIRK